MKGPAALSSVLDDLLAGLGLSNVCLQARIGKEWPRVVGSLLSGMTAPAKLRRGVLTILAGNHTVAQELQFMKPALIANVRALFGSGAVSDIRITVGAVPRADEAAPAGESATDRFPVIPPELEGLDAIPDPETRSILRSISRRAASRTR